MASNLSIHRVTKLGLGHDKETGACYIYVETTDGNMSIDLYPKETGERIEPFTCNNIGDPV